MRILPLCFVLAALAARPNAAIADPIRARAELSGAHSSAVLQQASGETVEASKATADGVASVSLQDGFISAVSTISSGIGPHVIVGKGATNAAATLSPSAILASSEGGAAVLVLFDLTTPHTFDFSALFTGTTSTGGAFIDGGAELSRSDCSELCSLFITTGSAGRGFPGDFPATLRERGLLQPGTYRLIVSESAFVFSEPTFRDTSAGAAFSFAFDLNDVTATPEPGSVALLSTGLVALVATRRRWRRQGANCRQP